MKYLCIDIGGTFMKYCVLEGGELSAEVQKKAVPQEKLEDLLDMIRSIYDEVIKEHTVDGVAISMPGVIETDKGYMRSGGSLQYIQEIPLADIISRRCGGIPVNIENDAKAAATAELATGALRNYSNAVLLTIGTAIGGAVIVEKTILRGWNLCAGEFSYMLYQDKAPRSFWGVHGVPRRMVTLYGDETVTSEQIIERMQAEDKKASEAFYQTAHELAVLIYDLQCVLDPQVFAIGGGISAQPRFIETVNEEYKKLVALMPWKSETEIKPCKYRNNANLIGAYHAMSRRFSGV